MPPQDANKRVLMPFFTTTTPMRGLEQEEVGLVTFRWCLYFQIKLINLAYGGGGYLSMWCEQTSVIQFFIITNSNNMQQLTSYIPMESTCIVFSVSATFHSYKQEDREGRIHLLACRNLLWDIVRLPSSRRAVLGLYVNLTLWRARGVNQPPYALLHIGARHDMHCATGDDKLK